MSALDRIAARAGDASPLWREAMLDLPSGADAYAGRLEGGTLLGVEAIREGYLMHHGRSRLFAQDDPDLSLLTGDYLYAAGLVDVCATGDLDAVRTLAGLISDCAQRRGEGLAEGDDALWDAAVAFIAAAG